MFPFPVESLPLLWDWLQEYPDANFDDYSPKTLKDFILVMQERFANGEVVWGIRYNGDLVGAVGIAPLNPGCAMFHGICFSKIVHGTGVPFAGVSKVLDTMFSLGVEKVAASYFADNTVIHKFFKKLGAITEGYLAQQTIRGGKPCDMRLVAVFKGKL